MAGMGRMVEYQSGGLVSLKFCFNSTLLTDLNAFFAERRKKVTFKMAIENVEHMQERRATRERET